MSSFGSTFEKVLTITVLIVTAIIILLATGVLFEYTSTGPRGDRVGALPPPKEKRYEGSFSGSAVVPASGSVGTGQISAILSENGETLSYSLKIAEI